MRAKSLSDRAVSLLKNGQVSETKYFVKYYSKGAWCVVDECATCTEALEVFARKKKEAEAGELGKNRPQPEKFAIQCKRMVIDWDVVLSEDVKIPEKKSRRG